MAYFHWLCLLHQTEKLLVWSEQGPRAEQNPPVKHGRLTQLKVNEERMANISNVWVALEMLCKEILVAEAVEYLIT